MVNTIAYNNVQLNLDSVEEIANCNKTYQKANVNTYNFTTQDWNYGPDIYATVKPTDRIIYLVRHSKRGKDYSSTGGLTPNGKLWAREVGEQYAGGIAGNKTYYGSTSVVRCIETSYYVAMGRNDSSITSMNDINNPIEAIESSYLVGSASGMRPPCKLSAAGSQICHQRRVRFSPWIRLHCQQPIRRAVKRIREVFGCASERMYVII